MPDYRSKKRLGQHFLTSPEVVQRILGVIDPQPGQAILEIGPGRGALTVPLAQSGAQITAVEFDQDIMPYLNKLLKPYENLKVINQDFLTFDPTKVGLKKFALVGNLPFNITSPVIDWVIKHRHMIDFACLMLQKELATRLTASPKSKDWSPLSIFTQLHFDVIRCFDISAEHFRPRPKVFSTLVKLTPKADVPIKHPALFEEVVRVSFRRRRKLLVNNLVPEIIDTPQYANEILHKFGLSGNCRAEELSIDQFLKLTERLVSCKILPRSSMSDIDCE
ncbi:MAG: 16S rRNA (adenine(1518)-N(6)/adenine(1519)-N(6))-dimethyltransferase RsmA [Candidatus Zixiibacteriota bacterium]